MPKPITINGTAKDGIGYIEAKYGTLTAQSVIQRGKVLVFTPSDPSHGLVLIVHVTQE